MTIIHALTYLELNYPAGDQKAMNSDSRTFSEPRLLALNKTVCIMNKCKYTLQKIHGQVILSQLLNGKK